MECRQESPRPGVCGKNRPMAYSPVSSWDQGLTIDFADIILPDAVVSEDMTRMKVSFGHRLSLGGKGMSAVTDRSRL